MSKPIGAILAGGSSRRMGHDKALVHFRGRPLLEHVAEALNLAGLESVVVGRDEPVAGYTTISDMPGLGGGPAVGLASALVRYPDRAIFLAAVDQPLIQARTVLRMLELPGDAVVPVADSHPQVTCALYREACRLPLQAMLDSGQPKLRRLLELIEPNMVGVDTWSEWGEDGSSWLSLDTPEALRAAEEGLRAAERKTESGG